MTKQENTKLYYEALSKIPKRFIDGETRCSSECFSGTDDFVVLANPKYTPMLYKSTDRKWRTVKIHPSTKVPNAKFIGFYKNRLIKGGL